MVWILWFYSLFPFLLPPLLFLAYPNIPSLLFQPFWLSSCWQEPQKSHGCPLCWPQVCLHWTWICLLFASTLAFSSSFSPALFLQNMPVRNLPVSQIYIPTTTSVAIWWGGEMDHVFWLKELVDWKTSIYFHLNPRQIFIGHHKDMLSLSPPFHFSLDDLQITTLPVFFLNKKLHHFC